MPSKDTTIIRSPISFKTYLENLQKILLGETGYFLTKKEVQIFLEKRNKQFKIRIPQTKKIVEEVIRENRRR